MRYVDGKALQDESLIDRFEAVHSVRLPQAFRQVVVMHDGADMVDAICAFQDPQTGNADSITCHGLTPFSSSDPGDYTMWDANDGHVDGLPEGLLVFGENAGGPLFCFDYRSDRDTDDPSVAIFLTENDDEHCVVVVARSFDDFVANLIETAEKRDIGPT